jgi:hypothetical protein
MLLASDKAMPRREQHLLRNGGTVHERLCPHIVCTTSICDRQNALCVTCLTSDRRGSQHVYLHRRAPHKGG